MSKRKNIFRLFLAVSRLSFKSQISLCLLFLMGVIIGGTTVYGYLNLRQRKLSVEQYQGEAAAYLKFKEIKESFIPTGVPQIYGNKLGISFDRAQDAINKIAMLDPTYGIEGTKIALTDFSETELERYKKIGASIACEYCCSAKSLTNEDGTAACGCAHSAMMRGLSAYLIKNYPQEFSDEQILAELIKWKTIYFPKQTLSAELGRRVKAGEPGIEQILQEFPDFLPQMVGGC